MKKIIILIIFMMSVNIYSDIIVNKNGPYFIGDSIGFNKDCHDLDRGTSVWNFGDGTVYTLPDDDDAGWQRHVFTTPGTYTVRYTHGATSVTPMCGATSAPYTESYIITIRAKRALVITPTNPRVNQLVRFEALNFIRKTIIWYFGEGSYLRGSAVQTHRYKKAGTYNVMAKDIDTNQGFVISSVVVSPDNRFVQVSKSDVGIGEAITVSARNFYGESVLWNFGDGTVNIGGVTATHVYQSPGNYTIMARDEGGAGSKTFRINVKVFGISDKIALEIAELRFDNGKYYKVVTRNSENLNPILRLKMRGTGIITGYWMFDGSPYGLINEFSSMGEVKEITTDKSLPIPTISPGLHTISFRLTKPDADVVFPILRFYVLPFEKSLEIISPPNGFVAKEDEIPEFRWEEPRGGVAGYQIAFSNSLFDLLDNSPSIAWKDVRGSLSFTPEKSTWNGLKRNRWSYWRVRALDSFNKVTGKSVINEIKIVVAKAEIKLDKATKLDGSEIKIGKNGLFSSSDMILIKGSVEYKDSSKYLILQVRVNDKLVDQLLFRNVKKGELRKFETSVPGREKGKIVFTVLKTSSPSVIVGIKGILIR